MPRETTLQIRMSTKERKELKAAAASKWQTESAYVRQLIKDDLERKKAASPKA